MSGVPTVTPLSSAKNDPASATEVEAESESARKVEEEAEAADTFLPENHKDILHARKAVTDHALTKHKPELVNTDNEFKQQEAARIIASATGVGVGIAVGVGATAMAAGGPYSIAIIILVLAIYSQKKKVDEFTNIIYFLAEEILQIEKCASLMETMAKHYDIPYNNGVLTITMKNLMATILRFLPTETLEKYQELFEQYANGEITSSEDQILQAAKERTDDNGLNAKGSRYKRNDKGIVLKRTNVLGYISSFGQNTKQIERKNLTRYLSFSKLSRMTKKAFSANELYRQAIRDIIIVNIFFSIATSEFDLTYKLMAVDKQSDFWDKHLSVLKSDQAKRFLTNMTMKNMNPDLKDTTLMVEKYQKLLQQATPNEIQIAVAVVEEAINIAEKTNPHSEQQSRGGSATKHRRYRKRKTRRSYTRKR